MVDILLDLALNPFPAKGFPNDEENRLALDRVKSIRALSAHSAVKGLNNQEWNRLLRFPSILEQIVCSVVSTLWVTSYVFLLNPTLSK